MNLTAKRTNLLRLDPPTRKTVIHSNTTRITLAVITPQITNKIINQQIQQHTDTNEQQKHIQIQSNNSIQSKPIQTSNKYT